MLIRQFSKEPHTQYQKFARSMVPRLAAVLMIASSVLLSCAGGAEARLESRQPEHAAAPELRRDEIKIAIQVAISKAKAGDAAGAMASVQEALNSARDKAALAGALEAKAWALLFAGSLDEAANAYNEYASLGIPGSPGRAVLEFRLAARGHMDAARRLADAALSRPDLSERAAMAIKVMLGEKDMRDVALNSPEAAAAYATYLAGYRLEPGAP